MGIPTSYEAEKHPRHANIIYVFMAKTENKTLWKLLGTFPCNYNDEMKIILLVLTKMLKYKDVSLVVETTKCQHLQKVIHVHSTCQPESIIIIQICCIFCT